MTGQPITSTLTSWLVMALFLLAIPVLVIWPIGLAFSPFDEKRLLMVTLLSACMVLVIIMPSLRRSWLARLATLPRHVVAVLVVILSLGVLSAARAQLPIAALTELALWVGMFTAMAVIAALRARLGEPFDLAVIAMLAFILFFYLLLIVGYTGQAIAGVRDLDFRMLLVNFSQPRFLNQFQSWTLPLAVLPLLYAQQRGWQMLKWVLALAAANWWALLYLSGGRGALVAVTTATVLIALLFKGRVAQWLKWHILLALGGLLIYLLLTQVVPALVAHVHENPALVRGSLSGRDQLWSFALTMIVEHPLLGVGPMHYPCGEQVWAGHPHNAPLQIAAEWGLPAALLLIALLLWLFYRAVVLAQQNIPAAGARDIAPLLLASLFAATLHAQLSGVIVMPISQTMMVVIAGWLWGTLSPVAAGSAAWRVPHTLWSMVMAASLVLLINAVSPQWRDAIQGTQPELDQTRLYTPRFWVDGAICREGSTW